MSTLALDIVRGSFLLALIACPLHFGYFLYRRPNLNHNRNGVLKAITRLRFVPIVSVGLAVVHIIIAAQMKEAGSPRCENDQSDKPPINPDIGGIGVLVGLFLPSCFIFLVLITGHAKAEPSGAKELCIAQLTNLVYITFNLAKAMGSLNDMETIVACISVDAVSASISMSYSDKDVLAARTLVRFSGCFQAAALLVEVIALAKLPRAHHNEVACTSQIHWVVPISPGQPAPLLIWAYLSIRIILTLCPFIIASRYMGHLNKAEQARQKGLDSKDGMAWALYPATLFSNYIIFFSLALLHGTTLILVRYSLDKSPKASWHSLTTEWGQSAALLVCLAVFLHVMYTSLLQFREEDVRRRLEVAKASNGNVWAQTLDDWRNHPIVCLSQRHPFGKLSRLQRPDMLWASNAQQLPIQQDWQAPPDVLGKKLLEALTGRDKEGTLYYLVDCKAPVTFRDKKHGNYPIHLAAEFGDTDVLQKMRVQHDDLLLENHYGHTPLESALNASELESFGWILKELDEYRCGHLANGTRNLVSTTTIDLINRSVIRTFQSVIMSNNILFFDTLTENYTSWRKLEMTHHDGSPLHFCVEAENVELTRKLLSLGAQLDSRDRTGRTPLECAIGANRGEIVDILFTCDSADATAAPAISYSVLAIENGYVEHLLRIVKDPITVLLDAASSENIDALRVVLKQGFSEPVLDLALDFVRYNWSGKDSGMAEQLLIGQGGREHRYGFLAVAAKCHPASLRSHVQDAKSHGYLDRLINLERSWTFGSLALTLVIGKVGYRAKQDIMDCVQILLDCGASIADHITADFGSEWHYAKECASPLHFAVTNDRCPTDILLVMLERQPEHIDSTDGQYDRTPLHHLVLMLKRQSNPTKRALRKIRVLLENEASITIRDIEGRALEDLIQLKGGTKRYQYCRYMLHYWPASPSGIPFDCPPRLKALLAEESDDEEDEEEDGEVECEGRCEGECDGECEGEYKGEWGERWRLGGHR